MRQQIIDLARRLRRQTREHVLHVRVGVVPIEPIRRFKQKRRRCWWVMTSDASPSLAKYFGGKADTVCLARAFHQGPRNG